MRQWRAWAALGLLAGCGSGLPESAARQADANEAAPAPRGEVVEFPSGGLRLRGELFWPNGAGPFPLVVFLHGSGADYREPVAALAPLYVNAGYAVFVPYRRGQGLSQGRGTAIVERLEAERRAHGGAARMRLLAELLATEQLDDVAAAVRSIRAHPRVDAERIAVAGNSFGGILAVLAAERIPGIRAAVASAPAALTWADAPELRERLLASARRARVPIFFFQAENDRNLEPTAAMAAAMAQARRPHQRLIYGRFGQSVGDGHSFGYFGGAHWGPEVFAFLERTLATRPTEGSQAP